MATQNFSQPSTHRLFPDLVGPPRGAERGNKPLLSCPRRLNRLTSERHQGAIDGLW